MAMLVAVTDHAAQRFRQRVRGTLDEKIEVASRVARAHAAGRVLRRDDRFVEPRRPGAEDGS
jgi:iron-sulfur cluster repair protein YtfE (RIC family)